jgi:hypothetical protein
VGQAVSTHHRSTVYIGPDDNDYCRTRLRVSNDEDLGLWVSIAIFVCIIRNVSIASVILSTKNKDYIKTEEGDSVSDDKGPVNLLGDGVSRTSAQLISLSNL